MALGQLALATSGSRALTQADGWVELSTFTSLTTAMPVAVACSQALHGRITYSDGPAYVELGGLVRIEADDLTRVGVTLAKNGTPFGAEWHGDVSPGIGPVVTPRLEWIVQVATGDVLSLQVASGATGSVTLTVQDLGLDLTSPQQSVALSGGARTTEAEVRRIMRVVPASYAVDLEVQQAHDLVERLVTPEGDLAEADLRWVELYLAAHLVALGVPSSVMESLSTDGASQRFSGGPLGMGLQSTKWGQQALSLDSTGKLGEGNNPLPQAGVWVMA